MLGINNFIFGLVFLVILNTCSTDPDFNRNNINDPKSEYYVPEVPENSPVSIALDKNKSVVLTWDKKELQDGVIISKRYEENSPSSPLDTLYGESLSYIDDSGIITSGTIYRVDFFRVLPDSSFVFNKEPALVTLKFASFSNISIYYDDRLEVTARYSGSPEKGEIRYFDGLEVLVNTSNNIQAPEWDTVGTISHTEFSNGIFRTDISFELFDLDVKVNQFIADSSGNRIPLKSASRRFYINSIDDVSFDFIDELNGTVRWDNQVNFGDGYIIESNRIDTVYGTPKNSYHLSLTEAPQLPFEVSIRPFINENYGETRTTPYPLYPEIVTPQIDAIKPHDHNSFEIGWMIFRDDQAAGYIIEQSRLPENIFTPIDTVSADQRSYVISSLDHDYKYNFAVHSYTSEWSRYITVGYQNTFVHNQSNKLDVPGFNIVYSKNGKYLAKLVPSEFSDNYEYIFIKDLETTAEYTLEIPREFDDWRAVFRDFAVSEKNNTLIFLWDRDYVDVAGDYISVYNFVEDKFFIENKLTPGYGGTKLELINDDNMVVISGVEGFTIFDTVNDEIAREIPFAANGRRLLRPYKNTAILCSESGLFEYDLTNGDIINQSNEYCLQGSINESSNLLTFFNNSSIKVLDLDSYSILKVINDERIDWNDTYDFWYFEEDDLLIYQTGFGVYNGYEVDIDNAFAFMLPSYIENRVGQIQTIKRESNGTYSIITFDAEFSFNYEEAWSLIEKGPRRL